MARYQHTFVDGDASAIPIRDAATVMIVRDEPEFSVLMVQRASRATFGASAWVFPGGRVDASDLADGASELTADVTNVEDAAGKGGAPWRTAAVRETLEEAGVLLSIDPSASILPDKGTVASMRTSVRDDGVDLADVLADHSIELDLGGLLEVGRFITPAGPPRRFDTWFFLAEAPDGQDVTPDGSEVVNARWVSPTAALELWHQDEFPLMSVTHRMLACLRRYRSVAEVVEHAASRPELRRVRVNDPDGAYEVLLPEDDGYDDADLEVEHGWVRL